MYHAVANLAQGAKGSAMTGFAKRQRQRYNRGDGGGSGQQTRHRHNPAVLRSRSRSRAACPVHLQERTATSTSSVSKELLEAWAHADLERAATAHLVPPDLATDGVRSKGPSMVVDPLEEVMAMRRDRWRQSVWMDEATREEATMVQAEGPGPAVEATMEEAPVEEATVEEAAVQEATEEEATVEDREGESEMEAMRCPMCREYVDHRVDDDDMEVLPCAHIVHRACMVNLVASETRNGTPREDVRCPTCRESMSSLLDKELAIHQPGAPTAWPLHGLSDSEKEEDKMVEGGGSDLEEDIGAVLVAPTPTAKPKAKGKPRAKPKAKGKPKAAPKPPPPVFEHRTLNLNELGPAVPAAKASPKAGAVPVAKANQIKSN